MLDITEGKKAQKRIELLFLATKKDFEVLSFSIQSASNVTSQNENVFISIVVPDSLEQECKEQLIDLEEKIVVVPESLLITPDISSQISERFKERAGWVIQQLLKLQFVIRSHSDGVLVVDSDTILLEPRVWLDSGGQQILTPTWEHHLPYYVFLKSLGICELEPDFTFVSHHMLMQPKILNELFEYARWKNIEDLAKLICSLPNLGEQSPFSLDYELYAQYLYKFHPDKVLLGKWSNKAVALPSGKIDRKVKIEEEIEISRNKFASLSFHSYL